MYGADWMKVLCSASFSVARCSRPMCGSARWITSPSSSSTRRSTPCAAGCCGPKLMLKLRTAVSAISLLCLFVTRQHVFRAFPRRQEIEIAEFLLELDRLVDHALDLVVVTHLDEAGEREILPQRMAVETVVGEQAAQIRMAREEHTVEVVGL